MSSVITNIPKQRTTLILPEVSRYIPATAFVPAQGLDRLRCVLNVMTDQPGTVMIQPAIQLASVLGNEDVALAGRTDWQAIGTAIPGTGRHAFNLDVSGLTGNDLLARFGYAIGAQSPPAASQAEVSADISLGYAETTQVVGQRRMRLYAPNGLTQVAEIGPWVPALKLGQLRWGVVQFNAGTNFTSRLVYRTANSMNYPSAWATVPSSTPVTGATTPSVVDTAATVQSVLNPTPPTTAGQWVQFGIQYTAPNETAEIITTLSGERS